MQYAKILIISLLLIFNSTFSRINKGLDLRKYGHVKNLYKRITPGVIKICLKYNIPPAAILAIAGLESGYGTGYIANITGNILSLNARKGDKELPPLVLARHQTTGNIIWRMDDLLSYPLEELKWELRPKSLKKDYRPAPYAGKIKKLDYFFENPQKLTEANLRNIEEFCGTWISQKSKVKVFVKADLYLEKLVKKNGKKILFKDETIKQFINMIGGKKGSFNYRKSWLTKIDYIIQKAGLQKLCYDIYINKNSFEKIW